MRTIDAAGVRSIDPLLGQYAALDRHPTNALIHGLCAPSMLCCVLALLWVVHPWVAYLTVALSLVYYIGQSPRRAVPMAAFAGLCRASLRCVPYPGRIALALYLLTWGLQLVGHHSEDKKAAFLDDLRLLLVGLLLRFAGAFRKAGIAY